jgi:hypothetical protein
MLTRLSKAVAHPSRWGPATCSHFFQANPRSQNSVFSVVDMRSGRYSLGTTFTKPPENYSVELLISMTATTCAANQHGWGCQQLALPLRFPSEEPYIITKNSGDMFRGYFNSNQPSIIRSLSQSQQIGTRMCVFVAMAILSWIPLNLSLMTAILLMES